MMQVKRQVVFALFALSLGLSASGCAKIKLFGDDAAPSLSREQVELRDVADRLEETPWPTPKRESFVSSVASILLGGRDKDETPDAVGAITRERAASIYLRSKIQADPLGQELRLAVMEDARATLDAATELTEIAAVIARAGRPDYLSDDVAVLEKAISDLRGQRAMYELIFNQMDERGLGMEAMVREEILASFSTVASDIGAAADELLQAAKSQAAIS